MATHTGSGSLNVNSGSGQQRNYTMAGGDNNSQYNADNISIGGMRFHNIQASGSSRQHVGNAYYYNTPLQYHGVQTKPKDDPVHANFIRACTEGRISRLNHLRSQGADIDHRDRRDATPLHHAAYCGHVEIVRYLLEAGADIDACGEWVGTPLSLASVRGHLPVVELLLENKADVNQECGYLGSAMHMACAAGALDIVKVLRKSGGSLNAVRMVICGYPFLWDVSSLDKSPLLSTSPAYKLDAEISVLRCSPGAVAVLMGRDETVKYSLATERGLSAKESVSIWRLTTSNGSVREVVKNVTLVMLAAGTFNSEMLTLLLAKGADPKAGDSINRTAMFSLGYENSFDGAPSNEEISTFVSLLKENGLDPNSQQKTGQTPLMQATDAIDSVEIAKTLLDHGASANIVDRYGRTALMFAVRPQCKSRKQFVELLCERGAFVNLKNLGGHTALDFAKVNLDPDQFKEVRDVLVRFGATEDVQQTPNTTAN